MATSQQTTIHSSVVYLLGFLVALVPLAGSAILFLGRGFGRKGPIVVAMAAVTIFYVSALLGLKQPEGDLLDYVAWFHMASNMSVGEYIFLQGKEPLYHFLVLLINKVTFGSEVLFLFITALLIYSLLSLSLIRILRGFGISPDLLAALIFLLVLFPPLFNISSQVLRQSIAAAIFIFGVSTLSRKNYKFFFGLSVSAIGVHTSILIPFGLTLISLFFKNASRFPFLLMSAAIILFFVNSARFLVLDVLASYGVEDLYMLSRIGQQEFFDLGSVKIETYILAVAFMSSLFIAGPMPLSLEVLLRTFALISAFVLMFGNDPLLSEVIIRISMLFYFVIWLPFLVIVTRISQPRTFITALCLVVSVWFCYNFLNSKWTFLHETQGLIFGTFAHFLNVM